MNYQNSEINLAYCRASSGKRFANYTRIKYVSIILFLFSFHSVNAQEKQIIYVAANGEHTSTIDSAYIIREIDRPKQGNIFTFIDFYKSGHKLKLSGAGYWQNKVLKFHGNFTTYNFDGTKAEELSFEHGENKGEIIDFFTNSQIHRKSERIKVRDMYEYDRSHAELNHLPNYSYYTYKINYLADSSNKVLIKNGNGFLAQNLNYLGEDFIEEGNFKDGFRDGVWKGKNLSGSLTYQETYKKGVLQNGILTAHGRKTKYNKLFTAPDYKYSNNHNAELYIKSIDFYKQYVPNFKSEDRGDYYIGVCLSINENGEVDQVTFRQPIANKKVEDALTKALLNMPKWEPATLRGIKTRANYISNIPFFKAME